VPDGDDVIVSAAVDHTDIALAAAEGEATLETDAATRVLLLWGRRPGDPSRIRSRVGPPLLGQVRTLLSGYRCPSSQSAIAATPSRKKIR